MPLVIEKIAATVVASLKGELDTGNAQRAEAGLLAQIDRGERRLVLDMAEVPYISQSGMRTVLFLDRLLKQQDGRLVVCGLAPQVQAAFEQGGLLGLLTVTAGRREALHALA